MALELAPFWSDEKAEGLGKMQLNVQTARVTRYKETYLMAVSHSMLTLIPTFMLSGGLSRLVVENVADAL